MMMMKWNERKRVREKNSLLEYWRRITSDEQKKKIKKDREKEWKKLRTRIYTGCRAKKAAFTNKFTFIHHIRTHEQTQIERAPVCVYAPPCT